MRINQTIVFYSLATLMFAGVACSSSSQKSVDNTNATSVNVTMANPTSGTDNSITVTGQVESALSANISTRVMGYITGIKVKIGDHVNKGQLLVTISNEDILAKRSQAEAAINSAQAAYNNAQKDFERFTALYKQKSATAKELDNVTTQFQMAKAGLESAKQMKAEANSQLAYTNIVAPFSGVVSQKLADEGSIANPGMPILVIEQSKELRVSAEVPEMRITRIHLSAPATVTVASVNKTFSGTVQEISPSSAATGSQFIIKVSLPAEAQQSLNAGMYASVNITVKPVQSTASEESILIPAKAVQNIGQLTAIYTISGENKALLRYVRLGKIFGDQVEVLSGLGLKESFILSAEGRLYNGVPVTVVNR